MREAGMQFWMLTGDKTTTAKQIGTMCKLTNKGANTMMVSLVTIPGTEGSTVIVDEGSKLPTSISPADMPEQRGSFLAMLDQAIERVLEFEAKFDQDLERSAQVFVVVDAKTLEMVLNDHEEDFARLSIRPSVKSVLCCRVTPKQKGRVVKMVKDRGFITLAIGDGGNDVPMIQEAHIGIGIVGKEGLQAARAADYSIAKFRYLARLVLVHGHWAYHRTSFMAQYSFYRCFFFCMFQLSYNVNTGASGSSWFLSLPITLFNLPFTGLSTLFLTLDRDVSQTALLNKSLYKTRNVYRHGADSEFMNIKTIGAWLIRGSLQGIICAWLVLQIYSDTMEPDGTVMDNDTTSMVAYTAVITIQTITVIIESSSCTWINHAVIWSCFGLFIFYILLMGNTTFMSMYDLYGTTPALFRGHSSSIYKATSYSDSYPNSNRLCTSQMVNSGPRASCVLWLPSSHR